MDQCPVQYSNHYGSGSYRPRLPFTSFLFITYPLDLFIEVREVVPILDHAILLVFLLGLELGLQGGNLSLVGQYRVFG